MTKEEYIKYYYDIKNNIIEKYSMCFGYLIIDIYNILKIEKVFEELGFITKRKTYTDSPLSEFYSEIYDKEKLIGIISINGVPQVRLLNRCRKYAKLIEKREDVIEPIEGIHRILRWHTIKGKYHILAGGETVLYFLPVKITDEEAIDFLTKTELIDKVDEIKKIEKNDNDNTIL